MALSRPKHDPFFSRSLEHPPIAHDFFKYHTPPYLRKEMLLNQLMRIDRTNTDSRLKQRERDIIYKVPLRRKGTAFLCTEHQSQAQLHIPLRVLRYHTDTVEFYLNAGNSQWPLVITIILYHGAQSPYPYPCEIADYYENPTLGRQQLTLRFYVIDLTQLSDAVLLTHGLCAPMEILLKHSRDGNFELPVAAYQEAFHNCIAVVGDDYLLSMLAYAKDLPDLAVGEKMYNFVERIFEDKQELIMTYGQKLEQRGEQRGLEMGLVRGIQQGMQQGVQQEKEMIAKNMLARELSMELVAQVTGLSKQALEKLSRN